MESRDQSDVISNQNYHADNQPHFAHSQYPYPPASASFSIDQDMAMERFAAGVQESANNSVSEPTPSGARSSNAVPALTTATGLATPDMAPPQTGGGSQSYSPTGPRTSIDDGLDNAAAGGDPKRKRSKVSRACDECRRKKVRCDAAGDDGSIKTCSNCQRAGIICGYNRVPMKRGPSKGYIKELSERVQQVESQMAMSNTPGMPGYRQSLDGASGMYSDQLYSPEDQTSFKRNFSFSDPRSPFTNPDFNRDRIPSVGGWPTSSPQAASFRVRDRGSLAIAPDQQTPHLVTQLGKPYWSVELDGQPPTKRQKTDTSSVSSPEYSSELLKNYYQNIHPCMPILCEPDISLNIVSKATPRFQHAFCAAAGFLTPSSSKSNDDQINAASAASPNPVFKSRDDLGEFIYSTFRESPDSRSRDDNLVFLWIQLMVAIEAENDLTRLRGGPLPKTILIKQVIELGWHCVHKECQPTSDATSASTKEYRNHLARVWYCAGVLARLHALAVGSENPIPVIRDSPLPRPPSIFTEDNAFVSLSAICLQSIMPIIQTKLSPAHDSSLANIALRDTVLTILDTILHTTQTSPGLQFLSDHIHLFFQLLLSRYTESHHSVEILRSAAALSEALCKQADNSTNRHLYNPFSMHFFTLTTITLLEFSSDGASQSLNRTALKCLDKLTAVLVQVADHGEAERQEERPNGDENPVQDQSRRPIHWADALLSMVAKRKKAIGDVVTNGNGNADVDIQDTNENALAVDFTMLLRYGYLTVLAESVGA